MRLADDKTKYLVLADGTHPSFSLYLYFLPRQIILRFHSSYYLCRFKSVWMVPLVVRRTSAPRIAGNKITKALLMVVGYDWIYWNDNIGLFNGYNDGCRGTISGCIYDRLQSYRPMVDGKKKTGILVVLDFGGCDSSRGVFL